MSTANTNQYKAQISFYIYTYIYIYISTYLCMSAPPRPPATAPYGIQHLHLQLQTHATCNTMHTCTLTYTHMCAQRMRVCSEKILRASTNCNFKRRYPRVGGQRRAHSHRGAKPGKRNQETALSPNREKLGKLRTQLPAPRPGRCRKCGCPIQKGSSDSHHP